MRLCCNKWAVVIGIVVAGLLISGGSSIAATGLDQDRISQSAETAQDVGASANAPTIVWPAGLPYAGPGGLAVDDEALSLRFGENQMVRIAAVLGGNLIVPDQWLTGQLEVSLEESLRKDATFLHVRLSGGERRPTISIVGRLIEEASSQQARFSGTVSAEGAGAIIEMNPELEIPVRYIENGEGRLIFLDQEIPPGLATLVGLARLYEESGKIVLELTDDHGKTRLWRGVPIGPSAAGNEIFRSLFQKRLALAGERSVQFGPVPHPGWPHFPKPKPAPEPEPGPEPAPAPIPKPAPPPSTHCKGYNENGNLVCDWECPLGTKCSFHGPENGQYYCNCEPYSYSSFFSGGVEALRFIGSEEEVGTQ